MSKQAWQAIGAGFLLTLVLSTFVNPVYAAGLGVMSMLLVAYTLDRSRGK